MYMDNVRNQYLKSLLFSKLNFFLLLVTYYP